MIHIRKPSKEFLKVLEDAGVIEHDESLEIGLAAGLDVPTAMTVSEKPTESKLPESERTAEGCIAVGLLVFGVLWELLGWLHP